MKNTVLVALALVASAAFSSTAGATNREDENVVGRAVSRVTHHNGRHIVRNKTGFRPIHTLKHAHPIRRLEGR